jgi:hypothetical protein
MKRMIGAALLAGVALGACSTSGGAQASGVQGQRSFEVGAFETVELEGSHNVVVQVGPAPSVRAEGDTAALERLDIRVENGRLRIGTERSGWNLFRSGGRVTVYVTTPTLSGADIAGSGDVRVGPVQSQRFAGSIAGSGNLFLERLQAETAAFDIAGSGSVRAAGQARQASIDIAGSGDAELSGLQAQNAEVSIAGSGNVALHASERVSGEIMGSGDVSVTGGARCSITKLGSGDVSCG